MGPDVVCVDLEWNPDGSLESPSVLQLAAVKIYNKQISDSFFAFIRPGDISDVGKILSFMPITETDLLNGREFSDALSEFSCWCGADCSFVLWGSYNILVFKNIAEGYLQIEESDTLDLQQVYMMISGTNAVSLEKASIACGITILYPLHNALNDAYTLSNLYRALNGTFDFDTVIKQFMLAKAERKREKRRARRKRQAFRISTSASSQYQFFADKDSGMIHHKGCPCLRDNDSQLKGFDTLKGSLKEGTALCSLCFNENISFDHDFTLNERIELINLHNLCNNLKIKSKNQGRLFSVITNVGSWYFIFGDVPTLYHHSNIYPSKSNKGFNPYHKQPVKFSSYHEMILYINRHDRKAISKYHYNHKD